MTINFISKDPPTYQCLSSDLPVSGSVVGISYIGAQVIVTDTGKTYRVLNDLSLFEFNTPVSGSISIVVGDIEIGAVELKDATSDARAKIISGSSILSTHNAIAVRDANPLPSGSNIIGNVGISGSATVEVSNFPAIQVTSGCITNISDISINLSASAITVDEVSGSMNILNFPAIQVVSGSITNFPAIQVVSGCVTNLPITYSGSVTNLPAAYSGSITNLPSNFLSGSIAIIQNVEADSTNSFSGSLAASGSFVGTSKSTLGIAGIQISLFANQNCTIWVEQSPDGTNWDISDSYGYYTSKPNFGITVQAVSSYFRVIVQNTGISTATTVRMQTALCPIVEALPRTLTAHGALKVAIQEMSDAYGFDVENTPTEEMRTITPYRLVGANFSGSVIDANYWTAGSGSGSIVAGGEQLIITTGSVANGNNSLQTVRSARYTGGSSNRARIVLRTPDSGTTDNVRRWGAFTTTDGAYFQLSGSTVSVVTRKTGVSTPVDSGAFNGDYGKEIAMPTTVRTYEIYWTNSKVWFVMNGELLHTVSASTSHWTGNMTLPVRFENMNSNNSATHVDLEIRTGTIYKLGAALTQPTSYYHNGQTTGVNLKIGAGNLHSIIFSNIANNAVFTLADSVTTTTPSIFSYTAGANSTLIQTIDMKGLPFFTGLRLTCTTANVTATMIYE